MLQSREMTLSKAIGKLLGMAQIAKCRETFRVGIRDDVKPVLKKYAPELIERYDSLHPDKAFNMGEKKTDLENYLPIKRFSPHCAAHAMYGILRLWRYKTFPMYSHHEKPRSISGSVKPR